MVSANAPVNLLLAGVDPRLLQPPVNVLRLGLHPDGLGPRVANYTQWRTHVLMRLRQQIAATADPILIELLAELEAYPLVSKSDGDAKSTDEVDYGGVVVPFRLRTDFGVLSFFSTTTVFGTPLDITLAELAIESFFPADPQTTETLNRIAREGRADGLARAVARAARRWYKRLCQNVRPQSDTVARLPIPATRFFRPPRRRRSSTSTWRSSTPCATPGPDCRVTPICAMAASTARGAIAALCRLSHRASLTAVPRRPHWQPTSYNALHGGLERWFEPIEPEILAAPVWGKLVARSDRCSNRFALSTQWFIEAHQFRIDTANGIGRPTPEGAHRDGVDFVAVILAGRRNIRGGETHVFDASRPLRRTFHDARTVVNAADG